MKQKEYNLTPVKEYLKDLQSSITQKLEEVDEQGKFLIDNWKRKEGGGGESRVLTNGNIFEQAGVNFSHVLGSQLPSSVTKTRPELIDKYYHATGVSLVIHPKNPYIPTTHANIRFFSAENDKGESIWWFGGGFDLTPYYPFHEDVISWHQNAYDTCKEFGDDLYPRFKKWCDDYFYLKHRNETRGVGGLFFDDFNELGFNKSFEFIQAVGNKFLNAYIPIVNSRKNLAYGDREREFQLYRRGRYVEFNLLYDRGTLFGIESDGRTESILMSLPPAVKWQYNWKPENDSPEKKLYDNYLKPRDWLYEK